MKLFASPSEDKSSGIFVPEGKEFRELTDEFENKSINGIAEHLGYNSNQVTTYFGDFDQNFSVQQVIVEIFTSNIVFVLTKSSTTVLKRKDVDYFMRNFNIDEVFDSVNTKYILEDGIKNKTLRIEYLARVLNIKNPDPNGIFNAISIGSYLYFNDGFLNDFQPSDGLNEWAKEWSRHPEFISKYETVAKLYWVNNIGNIIKEINVQAESFAKIPNAMSNEFIALHKTQFGTINFKMLLVCHYGEEITLTDFMEINHGRFTEVQPEGKVSMKVYRVGNFVYEFSQDGGLSNFYLR